MGGVASTTAVEEWDQSCVQAWVGGLGEAYAQYRSAAADLCVAMPSSALAFSIATPSAGAKESQQT